MAANEFLLKGVHWRIGTNVIKIFRHPWFQCEENPCITTVSPAIENKNVSDLMCMDGRC